MLAELPIHLERPGWLLLLLLIIPVAWLSHRSLGSISRGKAIAATVFRSVVLALLALALAQPAWVKRGQGLTLMMVIDVSQSAPAPLKQKAERYLAQVVAAKERPEDRVGVVAVARQSEILALPDELSTVSLGTQGMDLTATNLAAGLRQAQSILPQDTANRILLVSDGNETVESVLAEAEIARANGIPIDVLPLEYEHRDEVLIEGIRAPARARAGQSSELRIYLRCQSSRDDAEEAGVGGTLVLTRNGQPVDLDPDSPGPGLRVRLTPGPNVVSVPVSFDESGTHQFRAVFEPDEPAEGAAPSDGIIENNVGVAVTFVGGEGSVLMVASSEAEAQPLLQALRRSGVDVTLTDQSGVAGGLPKLNGYDAIVLVNMPRWALDLEADPALHAYVHDLGGGLLVIGGPESLGAGGWIDTSVAKALPVELDPPQTRQMPRGALALIMHSCEMPQGNYWGQEVARAAIEALSRLDYVGIITFNFNAGGINGSSWAFPMQLAGDKKAALAATRSMVVGDMPDFESSMQLANQGLMSVNAGQRHVIVISDGDPQPPSKALMEQYIADKITITTVMVAGHGTKQDLDNMAAVAGLTGGRFYNVTNPKNLPQVFVKEAQLVARSLIVEGEFQPAFLSRLPGPGVRFSSVPPVGGYVLTAQRTSGLAQTPLAIPTSEAEDPLFSYWNYGLGKSAVFTSDLAGRWGSAWVAWPEFSDFWEETVRWLMRPATPSNVIVRTRTEGERAIVEMEALDEGGEFLNFLRTEARVVAPDATVERLSLQQTGPGRYRGEFPVDEAGPYLVNIAFAGGAGGRTLSGAVQAAVAVPYSKEFRAVRDNRALLQAVADLTNGRMMSMSDPQLASYFDRRELEVPRSAKRVWDLLAILAAAIFIFDVAVRRISIEPEAVAATVRKLTQPAEAAGEGTVAAWKRARAQAGHRRPATVAEGGGQGGAAPGARQQHDPQTATRRYDAPEGGMTLDVAGDASSPATGRRPGADRGPGAGGAVGGAGGGGGADSPSDYTSRLLRAKRRAQSEDAEQSGDSGRRSDQDPNASQGGERG